MQTATAPAFTAALAATPTQAPSHARKANLFTRGDTLFGVCQGLGEDLGFNPNWLRVTFAVLLLANPTMVVGTYAALAVVVFVSRVIAPDRRWALPTVTLPKVRLPRLLRRKASAAAAAEPAPVTGDNDSIAETLAAAA
jgi:phage shock protein PspC (stress-responsive transcriptional regulator)